MLVRLPVVNAIVVEVDVDRNVVGVALEVDAGVDVVVAVEGVVVAVVVVVAILFISKRSVTVATCSS